MSMLLEIGTYLQSLGRGTMGTDLFAEILPPSPDQVIVLRELTGRKPERVMGQLSFVQPTLQVLVRGTALESINTIAWTIFADLNGFSGTLSGTRYLFIEALNNPRPTGVDENERYLYVSSYSIKKDPS